LGMYLPVNNAVARNPQGCIEFQIASAPEKRSLTLYLGCHLS